MEMDQKILTSVVRPAQEGKPEVAHLSMKIKIESMANPKAVEE
jgi:hypothetical protein